ncbi:unnamed protein product [Prunus armeniaca]
MHRDNHFQQQQANFFRQGNDGVGFGSNSIPAAVDMRFFLISAILSLALSSLEEEKEKEDEGEGERVTLVRVRRKEKKEEIVYEKGGSWYLGNDKIYWSL